ncbi:MAG: hypothetical protein M1824_001798 [Vezdaea acicularis]|nr:MAG: hypothetical protein M1824_001798 [Vezdaea acicularis]
MRSTIISSLLALAATVSAHTVITYPGWRGDTLNTNTSFPYGMQWQYPCGGLPTSSNRTLWPVKGGAIAIQPGWFQGHATAFFYINMGILGNEFDPTQILNASNPMVPPFQITGPSRNPYPGTFCLPQVPLPVNQTFNVGDNITIQVIEVAVHGAALYNCVDVTLANPEDVAEVNSTNCFNSSDIGFNNVYTMPLTGSSAATSNRLALLPLFAGLAVSLLVW